MDRSTFLKYSLTGAIGGAASVSLGAGMEALGLAAFVEKPSHTRPDKSGVTITKVEVYNFKKAAYVRVECSEGIAGWGEANASNKLYVADYVEKSLKPYLIGKDPFQSHGIWHEAYLKEIEAGMSGIHPGSLAGVDNALWDLKGKLLNMPAHKLIGGNGRDKIRVYASYGRDAGKAGMLSADKMATIAADFVAQGFKAVKVRLQIRQENVNPYPDDSLEVVKAVRKAIGDDIVLYADFNNGYTAAEAIVMGKRLYEHCNIAALEEPVFQQDYPALRQVVDALDIPIFAGEHEYSKWQFRDLITVANVDVLNADVLLCGLSECTKVAAMGHAFGKQVAVHNAKPTLGCAASLQLLASIDNVANFQEYSGSREHQGYGPLHELFDNTIEFEDGYLKVPQEPGLGLVVNEKAMNKFRR